MRMDEVVSDDQKKSNALALFKKQYQELIALDVTKATRKQLFQKYLVELKAKNIATSEVDIAAIIPNAATPDVRMNQQAIDKVVAELKPLSNDDIAKKIQTVIDERKKLEAEVDQLIKSRTVSRVG